MLPARFFHVPAAMAAKAWTDGLAAFTAELAAFTAAMRLAGMKRDAEA